jgi:hypothetical protein
MLGILTSVASWILIIVLSFLFVAVGVGSATHFLETSGSRAAVLNAHLSSLAAGANVRVPGRGAGNLIHHRDRGTPANSISSTTNAAVSDSLTNVTPPLSLSLVRQIRYICPVCRINPLFSSIISIVIAITVIIIAIVVFVTMSPLPSLPPIFTPLIVPSDITTLDDESISSRSSSSISSGALLDDDAETTAISDFSVFFSDFVTFFWKKRFELGVLLLSSFILAFDAIRRVIYQQQQQRGKGRGGVVVSPTLVAPSTPLSLAPPSLPSVTLPLTPLSTAAAQTTPNQIHQVQVDGGFFSERRLAAQAARAAFRAAEAAEILNAVVAATHATDAELKRLPASRLSLGRASGGG